VPADSRIVLCSKRDDPRQGMSAEEGTAFGRGSDEACIIVLDIGKNMI
jgi:hypothetical protein